MSRWMASRGARYLVLLNRSGAAKPEAQELVTELQALGVTVFAPPCDVSDRQALQQVLLDCQKFMPPIKGCIQGSMVLRDAIFANMSLEDYSIVVRTKISASRNLADLLPLSLDFFILLSSLSGIVGLRGQANYNVGNSYQDALARHLRLQGSNAVSIDLGMMLQVGYAAEHEATVGKNLKSQGYNGIKETEFLDLLDVICNPDPTVRAAINEPATTQIAIGFELPDSLQAKGADIPAWMDEPLFKHLKQLGLSDSSASGASGGDQVVRYSKLLAEATSVVEAGDIVTTAIMEKLAKALGLSEQDIDPSRPLHSYGVDSLVSVELRTWFLKEIAAEVTVFEIMGKGSVKDLGLLVAGKSSYVPRPESGS
jgi:KR domain/Phosphopantetheine attachment site